MTETLLYPAPAEAAVPGNGALAAARLLAATRDGEPLVDRLRTGIAAAVHLRLIGPGSRLPSVRAVSLASGEEYRIAVLAYRALAAEGLVEVRLRQGAFVAPRPTPPEPELGETAAWAAEVLRQAALLRIRASQLPSLLERAVAAPLRCLCVESVEDELVALADEFGGQWGMEVTELRLSDRVGAAELPLAARQVDLVVTTGFHAGAVAAGARAAGTAFLVSAAGEAYAATLSEVLRGGPVTVLVADEAYGDRLRVLPGAERLDIRVVRDAASVESLPAEQPVVVTPAARRRLGPVRLRMLVAPGEFVSQDAAPVLASLMVARNLGGRPAGNGTR